MLAVLQHIAIVPHGLVVADLQNNALHLTTTVKAFAVCAIIGGMALWVVKSDHRSAWMALPIVIVILLLATSGGLTALKNGGLEIWNAVFGSSVGG